MFFLIDKFYHLPKNSFNTSETKQMNDVLSELQRHFINFNQDLINLYMD